MSQIFLLGPSGFLHMDRTTLTSIFAGEVLNKCNKSAIPICGDSLVWFCCTSGILGYLVKIELTNNGWWQFHQHAKILPERVKVVFKRPKLEGHSAMLISTLDHGSDISNVHSSFPTITSHIVESISWPQIISEIQGG